MFKLTYDNIVNPKGVKPYPDRNVHGANMGPTWVMSAPGGPHVGPMNIAIWVGNDQSVLRWLPTLCIFTHWGLVLYDVIDPGQYWVR